MFRDDMMFETNSANPTYSAGNKISKIRPVLEKISKYFSSSCGTHR